MKTQHTPGPWIFNGGEVVDSHDNTIALVNAMNQWNTTEGIVEEKMPWEANARLMAAAPVMLEELGHASYALELASMAVPEIARERFAWQAKHLRRMIKLIEGDETQVPN